MKKAELIAKLEVVKDHSPVVSIDKIIALIQQMDPEVRVEKEFKMTQEFAEEIANAIERSLDYNNGDLVDLDSAQFELDWNNQIRLNEVDVNTNEIMEHVTGTLDKFIEEPQEDEDDEDDEEVIDGEPEE